MFMNPPFPRPAEPPIKPQYIVLFKGDDSDFQGNQSVDIVIDTELDTTGMKAHFRFMDFVQDFDSIPENKTLSLVFPNKKTSEFPLGAADATLRFEDASGKFRTISNRIHIVVTNSVHEAYDNEDSQSITVTVKGTVTWDMIEGKPDIPSEFPEPSDNAPQMDGEASAGESTEYSRGDHVHPTDTSRASIEDATLNPIYDGGTQTPTFSEWTFADVDPAGCIIGQPEWSDGDEPGWIIHLDGTIAPTTSVHIDLPFDAVNMEFDSDIDGGHVAFTASRTRTDIIGYTLGTQTDKPLQPQGDYVTEAGMASALAARLDGAAAYPAWVEGDAYTVDDIVSHNGRIWRSLVTNFDEPGTDPLKWNEVTVGDLLNGKQNALSSAQMAAVNSGATAAKVTTWDGYAAQIAAKANAADVDAALVQKASFADLPYALVTPGEWTCLPSTFEGEPITVRRIDSEGVYYLQPFKGDSPLTGEGLIGDIGQPEIKWNDSQVGFELRATRSSLPGHLLDRAVNAVPVSTNTELTLPALVNAGKARDFLVRLEISGSTVPTITFAAPTGETITYETDGDEFPVPDEAGTWLYSFTETAASTFAVSLKKVNEVAQGGV